VRVLTPQALIAIDPAFDGGPISPVLAGIGVVSETREASCPRPGVRHVHRMDALIRLVQARRSG
jgi:hypothetical protein